jgi:8-oxo-dGTP diphosphatase
MIHRNARPDDPHAGKYNGLGGKLDAGEDVVTGMCREIREEAGIECDELVLRGTISWPGFGKHGEDWFGFIFRIDRWHGDLLTANPEGTLGWVEADRVMPYRDGRPLSWSVQFLPAS